MLIEQAAYGNRWRLMAPGAKAVLAVSGLIAAFVATSPLHAGMVALVLALLTCLGAGIPWRLYLRVAAAPLGFLTLSSASLLVSIGMDANGALTWQWASDAATRIPLLIGRALAGLSALLLLALTTPLPDLMGLLRRLRCPDTLLDLMVLSYRMLFVLSDSVHDLRQAQAARLGGGSLRRQLHTLGQLATHLTLQVWQRAQALNQAAAARNATGSLRFLSPTFPESRRDWQRAGLWAFIVLLVSQGTRWA